MELAQTGFRRCLFTRFVSHHNSLRQEDALKLTKCKCTRVSSRNMRISLLLASC